MEQMEKCQEINQASNFKSALKLIHAQIYLYIYSDREKKK